MNVPNYVGHTLEVFKGNEVPQGAVETPGRVEAPLNSQTSLAVEGTGGEGDRLRAEREKRLELWMDEVKAFIRNIDVSKL